jgi:hypothetical protein
MIGAWSRLDPKVIDQLAKVCGLLGSKQDGERAAAAWQASRILSENGLTWRELVQAAAGTSIQFDRPPPWRSMADGCLAASWRLTEWEREFVTTLASYQRRPTDKQLRLLAQLHEKATMP